MWRNHKLQWGLLLIYNITFSILIYTTTLLIFCTMYSTILFILYSVTYHVIYTPQSTHYHVISLQFMESKYWHNIGYFRVNEVTVFPWDNQFLSEDMKKFYIQRETRITHPNLPDFLSIGSVIEQIGVVRSNFHVILLPNKFFYVSICVIHDGIYFISENHIFIYICTAFEQCAPCFQFMDSHLNGHLCVGLVVWWWRTISQKQLPRKMKLRLVVVACARYIFWRIFLWEV